MITYPESRQQADYLKLHVIFHISIQHSHSHEMQSCKDTIVHRNDSWQEHAVRTDSTSHRLSLTPSLQHTSPHTLPLITPRPPPSLPIIRIHNLKAILQPRLHKDRDVPVKLLQSSQQTQPSHPGAKAHLQKRAKLETAAQAFCSVLVSLPTR